MPRIKRRTYKKSLRSSNRNNRKTLRLSLKNRKNRKNRKNSRNRRNSRMYGGEYGGEHQTETLADGSKKVTFIKHNKNDELGLTLGLMKDSLGNYVIIIVKNNRDGVKITAGSCVFDIVVPSEEATGKDTSLKTGFLDILDEGDTLTQQQFINIGGLIKESNKVVITTVKPCPSLVNININDINV